MRFLSSKGAKIQEFGKYGGYFFNIVPTSAMDRVEECSLEHDFLKSGHFPNLNCQGFQISI
jgi:hypothetical protein